MSKREILKFGIFMNGVKSCYVFCYVFCGLSLQVGVVFAGDPACLACDKILRDMAEKYSVHGWKFMDSLKSYIY